MTKRESHMHLETQFLLPKCIHAAIEIGIADALIDGPFHVDAIAEATGTLPQPLYRLLSGPFHNFGDEQGVEREAERDLIR